jgi:hypothetical protein
LVISSCSASERTSAVLVIPFAIEKLLGEMNGDASVASRRMQDCEAR